MQITVIYPASYLLTY